MAHSWLKIITSLLLFAFIPVFPVKFTLIDADPRVYYLSVLKLLTADIRYRPFELWPQVIVFTPVFVLVAIYLAVTILAVNVPWAGLICSFGKFTKPDKAKVIILVIGMSTFPGYVLMYIAGCYGGLMGLPESLRKIFSLYDNYYFESIAIPITFVSFLFYNINGLILTVISPITFGTALNISNPFYLAEYNIALTIVLYAMMVVEWYLFSCSVVSVYREIKRRRQKHKTS